MHKLHITTLHSKHTDLPIEIVERKGLGHPDTICDALAEELSRNLCQFYMDKFGMILHHNVDKALLWGGCSQSRFGGGTILDPMEIYIAGRATCQYKGVNVPLKEMVMKSCNEWLESNFHALDVRRNIKVHSLIRPGSDDLVELYLRQAEQGIELANDTSCGVGYAPLSELEQVVLEIERHLNAKATKLKHPEIGEDIKVMGIKNNDSIDLTIACAFIDKFISDKSDYLHKKELLASIAKQSAKHITRSEIHVSVNTADNIAKDSLYLTVSGTSAESGDDGEVGRGNRVNGLITPYRPMNMEAAAGKNPVTHVGKLYNIVAQKIADALVNEINEIREANCYIVSRIGYPINEPQTIDIKLYLEDKEHDMHINTHVEEIVTDALAKIYKIRDELIFRKISIY